MCSLKIKIKQFNISEKVYTFSYGEIHGGYGKRPQARTRFVEVGHLQILPQCVCKVMSIAYLLAG